MNVNKPHLFLVERYLAFIHHFKPNVLPQKAIKPDNLSRLQIPHLLWMLNKMKEPNFKPLTSYTGWINWIQAGLYYNGIINPDHEIDISRDIAKQYTFIEEEV